MPNKKISELSAAGALTGAESVEIVQGGANVKTTTQDIANLGGGGSFATLTGNPEDNAALLADLNAKSDANATYTTKAGAYTMAAAELTVLNAGGTLEMVSTGGGALTFPNNATLAIPVGKYISIRGFASVIADGGGSADTWVGSNGGLDIPTGTTAVAQKVGTTSWILHNGAVGDSATETVEGVVELATAAEVITGTDTTRAVTAAGVHGKVVGVQDLYIPATAMWPRTTNPCADIAKSEMATSLLNIQTLDFDQTTQEFAQFTIRLPRKYDNGTITAAVYWTASAGSGTVQWGISGGAYSNDDALTVALGSAQTSDDTLIATNDLHISPTTSAITLAGTPAAGDFIALQISRNPASDTLTGDAKLLGVCLFITTTAAKDA